ncbi:MAG: c-type cytochrome domain-containing protein [Verrucomicrobium sp.]
MKLLLPVALVFAQAGALLAVDFKKDIQPILKAECYKCHSEESGKEKGGFVFDNLTRFAKDIGAGRTIEPGNLKESHFYETLVLPEDDDAHMPPKKTLAAASVAKIKQWIEEGASLDGSKKPTAAASTMPAAPAAPPAMQSWTNTEGKIIQAAMMKLDGENVVLRMPNGQVFNYPMSKLSAASQEQAKAGAK